MLANIIWGLIGISTALILVKFRYKIIEFTGDWGWAERYLGNGGSVRAVVLIAIILFFASIAKMTGKSSTILQGAADQFFGG
ncbi:MAG: hypothetical protein N4A36_00195 [Candidatus Gracilibacteria bacterium]|jgi:hypothetical protein|nr:hypothetical protein [Candidatus Gracilibacteria bacterium]